MSKNKEEGIIIDNIDVSTCRNIIFEYHDGRAIKKNVCECGVQAVEYYNMRCSDNPDCYYKQLQRTKAQYDEIVKQNKSLQAEREDYKELEKRHNEAFEDFNKLKQTNEKLRKTLNEIEEIAKAKVYAPVCFDDPNCPKNGGVGFDNNCDEYCPILTIEKILEKIKEVENEQ